MSNLVSHYVAAGPARLDAADLSAALGLARPQLSFVFVALGVKSQKKKKKSKLTPRRSEEEGQAASFRPARRQESAPPIREKAECL